MSIQQFEMLSVDHDGLRLNVEKIIQLPIWLCESALHLYLMSTDDLTLCKNHQYTCAKTCALSNSNSLQSVRIPDWFKEDIVTNWSLGFRITKYNCYHNELYIPYLDFPSSFLVLSFKMFVIIAHHWNTELCDHRHCCLLLQTNTVYVSSNCDLYFLTIGICTLTIWVW